MDTNMRDGIAAAGKFECGTLSNDGSSSLATYRPRPIPLLVRNHVTLIRTGTIHLFPRYDITKEMLP